jgi:hypothetical protein
MSKNDRHYFGAKIRRNYKAYPHTPVSAESQILSDFKIFGVSPYFLTLPPGYAIFRKGVSHREDLLRG